MTKFENLGKRLTKEEQKKIFGGDDELSFPWDSPQGCGGTGDSCTGGPYIDPFTPQYNSCCSTQFCINGRCTHP